MDHQRWRGGLLSTTTVLVVCLSNVAVGWSLGYRSATPYLQFWLLCGLLTFIARRVTERFFPVTDPFATFVRTAVVAFAIVVACGLILGTFSRLTLSWYLASLAVFAAASFRLRREPVHQSTRERDARDRDAPDSEAAAGRQLVPLVVAAVIVPLVSLIVGFGFSHSPMTLYDSLSYHLVFPARWLLDHQLSIVQTPFSDEAQAYQPANGELWFLTLMLPFHGDLVARIGQFPFLIVTGITLFAIARRMGARPEHAIYAPAFCVLSRPIVEQAVGADVDLVCAAMFLTSLYLGIVALDTDKRRDWALWGTSLGLYLGSKYLALIYTPVFVLLALARGPRAKALWAIPGVIALALPWYVRNWIAGGSPIYPATLKVLGLTVGQGAYDRSAMLHSVFHTTDLRLLPIALSHAVGAPLSLVWLPFGMLGAISVVARTAAWPGRFVLLALLLMIPLYWFGVPDNVDSRFLLPAAVLATVLLAFPFGENRLWNGAVHGLYVAAVVWILVGMHADLPVDVPWFMRGWLTLDGLVERRVLPLLLGVGLIAAGAQHLAARSKTCPLGSMVAIASVAGAAISIGSEVWCLPSRCDLLQVSPTYIRSTMLYAWSWAKDNAHGATFANTGNNLPYPLFGDQLTNRVYYANIDHHLHWRFHDYDHAHRKRPRRLPSNPLARSSGVLLEANQEGPEGAVRPRYERMDGSREAWIGNLKALGVDHLFVSTLSAYEIDYVWHNADGFPIEEQWAQSDRDGFHLVYENPQVRIYTVSLH